MSVLVFLLLGNSLIAAPSFLGISPNANGEYVIKSAIDLKGRKVSVPTAAVLRFDGGSLKNGILVGQNSYVSASQCQVFYNVEFLGRFCSTFEMEWIGAKADNKTDNSDCFNKAFGTNAVLSWHAGCGWYVLKKPVHITQNVRFKCDGKIKADGVVGDLLSIESHDVCLDIDEMWTAEGRERSAANAIGIVANSQYNNITIRRISGFNKGINLAPRAVKTAKAGISYNVFTWQRITCNECLVFDLNGPNDGTGLWITENQFNGGQLEGGIGLVQHGQNDKSSRIHGNVFNCMAFEGLDVPVKGLYRWYSDFFYDTRMSTGENQPAKYYIEMTNCEDVHFRIKAKLASDRIYTKNCTACEFITADKEYLSGRKDTPDTKK